MMNLGEAIEQMFLLSWQWTAHAENKNSTAQSFRSKQTETVKAWLI